MKILYHPIFVHFPIAFYALELGLLFFWIKKCDEVYRRFALLSFKLGYGLMLAVMLTGLVDAKIWSGIHGLAAQHFYAAIIVFVVYTLRAFCWKAAPDNGCSPKVHLAGAILGNILVGWTAYCGGRLVYQ